MRWTFDRADRFQAVVDRTLAMSLHLRRELSDAPTGAGLRGPLVRRLAIVEARLARFRLLARVARHNARLAAVA